MKKIILKILSLSLSICFFTIPSTAAQKATSNNQEIAVPFFNNTSSVNSNMTINTTGLMSIKYSYNGLPNKAKKVVITTTLEKRYAGIIWKTVDIGQPNNQWVDTIYDITYNHIRRYQLSKSGTYRVKILFKVYGSGGTPDEIPYTIKDSY